MTHRHGLLLAFVALAIGAAPAPAVAVTEAAPSRLAVLLDSTPGRAPKATAATTVSARAGVRLDGPRAPQIGLVTVSAESGAGVAAAVRRLRADPAVVSVAPVRRMRLRYVPDDLALQGPALTPRTTGSSGLQWWAAPMGLPRAWDVSRGSRALVAVIDTGADGGHPELAGKIRDAIDLDDTPGTGSATTDEHGHGTHVASLACAQADNRAGIAGAGLGCGLLVIKSDLTDASVATGIVEAVDRGADAINMSFGSDDGAAASAVLRRAIDYAVARNVVLVAAAADEPTREQGLPSNLLQPTGTGPDPRAGRGLSVTAATSQDARASFAGLGTQISLAAYGSYGPAGGPPGLLGAFPLRETEQERGESPCRCRTTLDGDTRYAYLQGTSMAAPLVTAVAALARDLNPDLSLPRLLALLKQTARRPAGGGWTPDLGWGIVDGGAALTAAAAIDATAPVSRLRVLRRARNGRIVVGVRGADRGPSGVVRSGIARYEIHRFVAGQASRRVATTTGGPVTVAAPGGRSAWFSIAVDRAGNREARPGRPDARVG